MTIRTFALAGNGSQLITITQEGVGTPMTVCLNDCMLGTLPPPEQLYGWWTCSLADGSLLHVGVANQQVQLWHQGLPLAEVRPQALVSNQLTRWIMLLCASFALVLGLLSLCMMAAVLVVEVVIGVINEFSCIDPCSGTRVQPPSILSSGTMTTWCVLLAVGGMLLALITCTLGFYHALATHRQRMAFVLGPLLLVIASLISGVVLSPSDAGFSPLFLISLFVLIAFFASFPASFLCLVYAARLK